MTEYDELVKNLRICSRCDFGQDCNGCTQKSDDAFCCDKLLHEAADTIEELQAQLMFSNDAAKAIAEKVPKWIPVVERLPKIHTMVLVMDKAHDMTVGSLEKLWDGEVWVCPFADVEDEQCPITHWLPLPEPPKEEA